MPPRKRRQSAQGEDIVKESEERGLSSPGTESDVAKVTKSTPKASDKVGVAHEKPSTPKQLLKQETSSDVTSSPSSNKNKESAAQSMPTAESNVKQPTRFSTRIVKRPRRDLSPPESPVKKGKKVSVQPVVTTPETKGKRQWELWSVEDKDSFFEGLCEYGKDFESIHTLIVNKCKKKGNVLPITVKNKEQVRHFYYRTWHKISKLIEPVDNLKKDIQELYGLISYSVLRKKLRGGVNTSDKNWQKLNDLVHQGVATIKVKGKRIRVKTPACNALKKLNNVEETRREPGPKVPEKIRVEFRPKTNLAWQQVQDVSHNPRVRLTVRSDRHLQSLVKYLEQKWKPQRLKLRENLGNYDVSRNEFRVFPHRNSTLQTITMEQVDEPTLHFGLNKHKECNFSPSNAKKKKDKDQCNVGKSSAENIVDISKSVIPELNCLCKETCNSCAFKEMKNCGFSIDLMKTCAGKNGTLDCSCTCNIDKNTSQEMDKNSDKAVLGGATSVNGQREPPARSLFGTPVEGNDVKSPCDFNDSRCVLRQKDSPLCRTDEVSSALPFARSLSGHEVSAIADGENAMFPDSISKTSVEGLEDGTASDGDVKEEEANSDDGLELDDEFTPAEASQADFEKMFKTMMETGWNVQESEKVTLAELYLMFGEDGEIKFEYEWINHKTDVDLLHEKLLNNLNNMLRRLSHLATIEFTDLKTPGSSSVCQSCGQSPNGKKTQNKGKDKSPPGPVKVTKHSKEVSTQTQAILNPIQLGPGISTSSQNGVFRIPVLPPSVASTPKTTTTTVQPSKELLARYNATTTTTQKQLMRPRKIKHTSRQRPGTAGSLVQRTILPKNSEYITIIPMVPGTQIPNHSPDKGQVETIVGHPINGIQKQPVNVPSVTTRNPVVPPASPTVTMSPHTQESTNMVEMSLSPDGDQTLLRIPASHLSTMSKEALKAAGFSTMPGTPVKSSVSMVTTDDSSNQNITTTLSSSCKSTSSPPNLSLLLDMSLPSGDIENDTTFNSLLDDNSKTLTVDPVLTTPPMRSTIDTQKTTSMNSPPVRSLFRSSPTPDSQQWLGSDVTELSLSSFLESPSKQSMSSTQAIFNPNMPLSLFNENSREFTSHRIDVDTTFQSMMNESSIDYMKKFADLAEQITQQDTHIDHTRKLE